jgi:1-acyl-sn-glycerol-3-phosphate acyltransferase
VEPVYGTVIQLARLTWRVQGLRFTVTGVENLPATGGAVIAINHTSYFDFTFAGLPAYTNRAADAKCGSWPSRRSSTTRSPGR